MKRKNVPQIINQDWFPPLLKRSIYEFMTWFVQKTGAAQAFLPLVEEGMKYSSSGTIINIDQQIGAGIVTLRPLLAPCITIQNKAIEQFHPTAEGLYLSVNSFHQLNPQQATN